MSPMTVVWYWVSTNLSWEVWTVWVRTWLLRDCCWVESQGQDLVLWFVKEFAEPCLTLRPFVALSQMSGQGHRTKARNQGLVSQTCIQLPPPQGILPVNTDTSTDSSAEVLLSGVLRVFCHCHKDGKLTGTHMMYWNPFGCHWHPWQPPLCWISPCTWENS